MEVSPFMVATDFQSRRFGLIYGIAGESGSRYVPSFCTHLSALSHMQTYAEFLAVDEEPPASGGVQMLALVCPFEVDQMVNLAAVLPAVHPSFHVSRAVLCKLQCL